jgi:hypothetical protein
MTLLGGDLGRGLSGWRRSRNLAYVSTTGSKRGPGAGPEIARHHLREPAGHAGSRRADSGFFDFNLSVFSGNPGTVVSGFDLLALGTVRGGSER